MRKVITGILIILLVVCLAVMGVSIAFIVNGGENPFKQNNTNDDQVVEEVALRSSVMPLATSSNTVNVMWGSELVLTVTYDADKGNIHFVSKMDYGTSPALYFSTSSSYTGGKTIPLWDGVISTYDVDLYELVENGTISYDTTYYVHIEIWDWDAYSTKSNLFPVKVVKVVEELPEPPTKTGYTFTGWYTDEECTQLYEEDYVTSDITLYAGFRANRYTVVFNPNCAAGDAVQQTFNYDTAQNLQDVSFDNEHYKLLGWATSEDGEVVYSLGQSVTNLTATDGATIQLYAVWERIQFNVTFIVNGEIYSVVSVPSGTALADIINGNVNSVLFFVSTDELNGLPYELTEDMSVTLQTTKVGEIYVQDWFWPAVIGFGALVVSGVLLMIIMRRGKSK